MGTLHPYPTNMMMKRAFLALTMLVGVSLGTASAETTGTMLAGAIDANIRNAVAQVSPQARTCTPSQTLRIAMYAAQAADAFTTGAAVQHGAIGRTPFGTKQTPTAFVTQAALDTVVDLLTRHTSCQTKNFIHAAIGGSALFNALHVGNKQ